VDWALFIGFHDLGRPDFGELHHKAFEVQMAMISSPTVSRGTQTRIEVVDE
jgi:hypothetical protein